MQVSFRIQYQKKAQRSKREKYHQWYRCSSNDRSLPAACEIEALEIVAVVVEMDGEEVYLGTIDTMLAAHKFYIRNGFVEIDKSQLPETFPVMKVDNKFFKLAVQ